MNILTFYEAKLCHLEYLDGEARAFNIFIESQLYRMLQIEMHFEAIKLRSKLIIPDKTDELQ